MRAGVACPIKIVRVRENGIPHSFGITEKRGKERHRNSRRRKQHHNAMRRPNSFDVVDPLTNSPPSTKHHTQRGTHRAKGDNEGFLCGVHHPKTHPNQ